MLRGEELSTTLASTPQIVLDGFLFRAVDLEALYGFHQTPPYPTPRPLYSLGSPKNGARFTPKGGPKSLYMAVDAETALAEASQVSDIVLAINPTIAPAPTTPKVMYSAKAYLVTVLDLTLSANQSAISTSLIELTSPWRNVVGVAPTQELGQAVFDSGRYQAILFPSSKKHGHACVVIFTDRLAPAAFIEVYDPHGNLQERIP